MLTGSTSAMDAPLQPDEAWRAANYLARTVHYGNLSQDYMTGWWDAMRMLRSQASNHGPSCGGTCIKADS